MCFKPYLKSKNCRKKVPISCLENELGPGNEETFDEIFESYDTYAKDNYDEEVEQSGSGVTT